VTTEDKPYTYFVAFMGTSAEGSVHGNREIGVDQPITTLKHIAAIEDAIRIGSGLKQCAISNFILLREQWV
jgi:trehalose-6-phosphatase